jgi:hypothetical protein
MNKLYEVFMKWLYEEAEMNLSLVSGGVLV